MNVGSQVEGVTGPASPVRAGAPGRRGAIPDASSPSAVRRDRVVAYIGDPSAVGGVGPLFEQKAAVDALVRARPVEFLRYYVDSGRGDGPVSPGTALAAMVVDAVAGSFDRVYVRTLADLSPDPAIASGAVAALGLVGVRVTDAEERLLLWTQSLLALAEEAA